MSSFPNGSHVTWLSNKSRLRTARTVTRLNSGDLYIVQILKGLPGEIDGYRIVPGRCLAYLKEQL